jgi:hypothetical protein
MLQPDLLNPKQAIDFLFREVTTSTSVSLLQNPGLKMDKKAK